MAVAVTGSYSKADAVLASARHGHGPSVRGFIREIDGLRGIATLLVVGHHFWPTAGVLAPFNRIAQLGWIGVDLFYVLSGFLITGILLDTRDEPHYFRNYLARRILRVFPLYYLFVIAAFVLIPLLQGGPFWDTEFVRQAGSPVWYLFYAGNVREAITGVDPAYVLAPTWSLCIEEQFYLVMPLLVALLNRRSLTRFLLALLFLAPVFRTVTWLLSPENERIQYLLIPSRFDVLAMGCLLAIYFRSERPQVRADWLAWLAGGLVAVCAVVFALGGLDRTQWFCRTLGYSLLAATFAAIVGWALASRDSRATAILRVGPLCYLGKLCYGIYLLQRPAEVVLNKTLLSFGVDIYSAGAWLMFAKFAAALAAAVASWYLFERPILRLKRLFASHQHPGQQQTAAVLQAASCR